MKRIGSLVLIMMLSLFIQAVGAQDTSAWVTVQKFERGLMMWRSDNSTIWVLINDGRYKAFPAGSYSNYKDNVITSSPTGRVPMLGFGKVWGNFTEIRRAIGAPTSGESGVAMNIRLSGGDYSLSQIDGTSYSLRNDGRWVGFYNNQPPTPEPAINVWVSIQRFERGMMVWRSDNSTIWVLGMNGQLQTWPASAYSRLADNTINNNPFGYNPMFGFGKVWGNNVSTRDLLGWALEPEGGLSMTIQPSNGGYKLTQPNGTLYTLQSDNRWVGSYTPPSGQPRIVNFAVTPDRPVAGVDAISMQWEVRGTSYALIEVFDGSKLLISYKDLNLSGTERFTTPRITSNQLRLVISAANKTTTGYDRKASLEKIVAVTPNPDPTDIKFSVMRGQDGAVTVDDSVALNYTMWGAKQVMIEVFEDGTNKLLTSKVETGPLNPGVDVGTIRFVVPETKASKLRIVMTAGNVLGPDGSFERLESIEGTLNLRPFVQWSMDALTASPDPVKPGDSLKIDWSAAGTQQVLIEIYDGDTQTLLLPASTGVLKGSQTITVPAASTNKLRIVATAVNSAPAAWIRRASKEITVSLVAASAPTATVSIKPDTLTKLGGVITAYWTVTGANNALIEIIDSDTGAVITTSEILDVTGTNFLNVPPSNASKLRIVVTGVFVGVAGYERKASGETTLTLTSSDPAVGPETITTYAAYQAFEHGIMIWRADNEDVYVLGSSITTFDSSAGLADNADLAAPDGKFAPINAFGRIWANNAQIKSDLGWAVGAEQGYTATVTTLPGQSTPQSITLPDGRTVALQ